MRFGVEDEAAFQARCDELLEDYAGWLQRQQPRGADAGDARVALDWKWGYAGGDLATWTVEDLDEFLLEWCPRKLSMAPEECSDFPASIGMFCTFLAARGLLSAASSPPATLYRHCERGTRTFVRKVSDPANFGMAKGLLAGVGGLDAGMSEEDLARALERLQSLPLGDGHEDLPVLSVGPVRHPDPDSRVESAAAAPALGQLHRLWEYCTDPGRPVTQKGNLRLADARHLVELLPTSDIPDVERGRYRRTLRSAEDLPELSWLVQLALDARVLRKHRGRVVAVAAWAELGPVEALDRLVDAAVERGLSGFLSPYLTVLAPVREFVDDGGPGRLLAELLDWRAVGQPAPIEELAELIREGTRRAFGGLNPLHLEVVRGWARDHVDRLAALGLLTVRDVQRETDEWGLTEVHGGTAELTPAGVAVAVRLAEDIGITVLALPDPATASAADLVELIDRVDPEQWRADAAAWAQRRDGREAARELVAALGEPDREASVVLAGLSHLEELVGEHARPAVETLLDGPHDGLAVQWLMSAGALAAEDVGPERLLASGVDMLAVALEIGGPEELLAVFGAGERADQIELLEGLWRVERPRTAELLEAIGAHHPDRSVAKAARKCLVRHRSRLANSR
jgi:hypothetical protein